MNMCKSEEEAKPEKNSKKRNSIVMIDIVRTSYTIHHAYQYIKITQFMNQKRNDFIR